MRSLFCSDQAHGIGFHYHTSDEKPFELYERKATTQELSLIFNQKEILKILSQSLNNLKEEYNKQEKEQHTYLQKYSVRQDFEFIRDMVYYWPLQEIEREIEKMETKQMLYRVPKRRIALDIEKARSIPIENLYSGVVRKSGARFLAACPFHAEKTPSFFIFPNNRFFCFGCNEKGSSIDFIMKTRAISFVEAVKILTL